MDELIKEQLEWLLSSNGMTNRLGRQLVTLVGFLAEGALPEDVERQVGMLSRLLVLQDLFDALVGALNNFSHQSSYIRSDKGQGESALATEMARLLDHIEAARRDIAASEPVNYASLIAWVVAQARARKILKGHGRR